MSAGIAARANAEGRKLFLNRNIPTRRAFRFFFFRKDQFFKKRLALFASIFVNWHSQPPRRYDNVEPANFIIHYRKHEAK